MQLGVTDQSPAMEIKHSVLRWSRGQNQRRAMHISERTKHIAILATGVPTINKATCYSPK